MLKHLFRTIIILSGIIFSFQNASASHIMGADITYKCLGNNQYEITLDVYNDCASTVKPSNSYSLTLTSISCAKNFTFSLPKFGVEKEVSGVCATYIDSTKCNGGNLPGTEKWTYRDTIQLTSNCSDWVIGWSSCDRNNAITNIKVGLGVCLYTEATLNNANGLCNSSPQYASLPIPYICSNQLFTYSHGAFDSDGDSLSYQLAQPLSAAGKPISYNTGYSITEPVKNTGGFNFNPETGTMCFTPSQQQFSVVSVKVLEYRNGVLIGTYLREMQLVVSANCSNTPPTIGGGSCSDIGAISNLKGGSSVNQTDSNVVTMCPGDSISFNMRFVDNDGDKVTLTSQVGVSIPGATLSVDSNGLNSSPIAKFSWMPTVADTGVNILTLISEDNSCPVKGVQSFAFIINVWVPTYAGEDQVICGPTAEFPGNTQLKASGGTEFVWSVISGEPLVEGVNFSCDTCATPIATPSITTTYEVVSNLSFACKNRDTVTVFVVPDYSYQLAQSKDTICLFDSVQFYVTPSPSGNYTYNWFPKGIWNNDTVASPKAVFEKSGLNKVYFDITSADGCLKSDTFYVYTSGSIKPVASIITDTTVCVGDSVRLSLLNGSPSYSCEYTLKLIDYFNDGWNTGNVELKIGAISKKYTLQEPPGDSLSIKIPVNYGDTIKINYTPSDTFPGDNVYFLVNAVGDIVFADGDPIFSAGAKAGLVWTGIATCPVTGNFDPFHVFSWEPSLGLNDATTQNPWVTLQGDTTYLVTVKDTIGGCSHTTSVTLNQVPTFSLSSTQSMDSICAFGTSDFSTTPSIGGGFNYQWYPKSSWSNDTIPDPIRTFLTAGTQKVYVDVTSDAGCQKTDTFTVVVSQSVQPIISVLADTTLCMGDSTQLNVLNAAFETSCNYTLKLYDSGSSGWSNGKINFTANTTITSYTITSFPGDSLIATIPVFYGDSLKINYFPSSFSNYQNFYILLSADGDTLFKDGDGLFSGQAPKAGNVWSDVATCPTAKFNEHKFSWTPSSWLSDSTVLNPWVKPQGDLSYTVIVRDTLGGCGDTASVTIYSVPAFLLSYTQTDTAVCMGEQTQVTLNQDVNDTYTYVWDSKQPISDSTLNNPVITHTNPGMNSMMVSVTNSSGCTRFTDVTVNVSLSASPKVTVGGDTVVCLGDPGQLVAYSTTAAASYFDNFNFGIDKALWADTSGGTLGSPCGSVSGNALNFGGPTGKIRQAKTNNMNVVGGGKLSFSIKMGTTSQSPCEQPDPGDDIVLEYSIDNGSTWINIATYLATGYKVFTKITEPIPSGAQTVATLFRWRQINHSGQGFDNWSLDDVSVSPNISTYNYLWTPSFGLSDSTVFNPYVSLTTDQTYTVKMTDTLGGCSDATTVTVKVVPTFTYTTSQSEDSICLNEQVQLSVTPSPTDTYTYNWSSAATLNNTSSANPFGTFGTPGTIYSYFKVISSKGCSKKDSILVRVSSGEVPNLAITGNSDLCTGDAVKLIAKNINNSSISTYVFDWSPTTDISNDSSVVTYIPTTKGTFVYTVKATDTIGGCIGTANVTIKVNSVPDVTLTDTKAQFCMSDSTFTFKGTPVIGGAWSGAGISVSGVFDPRISGPGNFVHTYTVTQGQCSANKLTTTRVYANPSSPVVSTTNPNCKGNVIKTINSTGSGGTIAWYSDAALSTPIPSIDNLIASQTMVIYAQETSQEGCKSDSVPLTIEVVPKPQISFTSNPTQGLKPLASVFTNTSVSSSTVGYLWDIGGLRSSNQTDEAQTFTEPGKYSVILVGTDLNGCYGVDSVLILVEDEVKIPTIFTPNGDGNNDVFKIDSQSLGEFTLTIFNRWGKVVYGPCTGSPSHCVWDGKNDNGADAGDGTYYYVVTGKGVDGNPLEQDNFRGYVTLMRSGK